MSDASAVISVRDLVFDYANRRALHGVSFDVPRAAVLALVGPNGAGKTTLMRCIAGLQEPLSGAVTVAGINAVEHRRQCRAHLGYLSDFFGLYDTLSSEQCLLYMAWAHGLRGDDAERAITRASQRVAIKPYLNACAGTLSRGLRQRLALAMSLVHEPDVLLLDEPASGLDPEARHGLARLLTELREQGTTLIVSSHLLSELEEYSTQMLVLDAGRVVEQQAVRASTGRSYALHVVSDMPAALQILQDLPLVQNARVETDYIVFDTDEDAQSRADLLKSLMQQGVAFSSFHEHVRDIQQLYLTALARRRGERDES